MWNICSQCSACEHVRTTVPHKHPRSAVDGVAQGCSTALCGDHACAAVDVEITCNLFEHALTAPRGRPYSLSTNALHRLLLKQLCSLSYQRLFTANSGGEHCQQEGMEEGHAIVKDFCHGCPTRLGAQSTLRKFRCWRLHERGALLPDLERRSSFSTSRQITSSTGLPPSYSSHPPHPAPAFLCPLPSSLHLPLFTLLLSSRILDQALHSSLPILFPHLTPSLLPPLLHFNAEIPTSSTILTLHQEAGLNRSCSVSSSREEASGEVGCEISSRSW